MLDRLGAMLIDHLVAAATRHARAVLLAILLLAGLSVVAVAVLLDVDLTFKGMIGDGVDEVDAYGRVIRDFEVSGVTTVAVEPLEGEVEKIRKLQNAMDARIFESLDAEGHLRVMALVREGCGEALSDLTDKNVVKIAIETLVRLPPAELSDALALAASLSPADRDFVIEAAAAGQRDDRTTRSLVRKLLRLPKNELAILLEAFDLLAEPAQGEVVRFAVEQMPSYSKETLIEESEDLADETREELFAALEKTDSDIEKILVTFKERAQRFADTLKENLSSRHTVPGGSETFDQLVKGVLYSEEFSISQDELMFLMMVSPQKNIDELQNAKAFVRAVDAVLEKMRAEWDDLRIRRTGFAAVQMDAQDAMFEDFWIMMALAMVGIILIFVLGLGSVAYPLLAMIPLVLGVVIMFGLFSLYGTLNLMALMTPIILFGQGTEYAVHFGSRYGETRRTLGAAASQAEVLRATFQALGPPMLVAALTTIFAFIAMTVSKIEGFAEAGILAASGTVSSCICMIYLLPIIVLWLERRFGASTGFLRGKPLMLLARLATSWFGKIPCFALLGMAVACIYFLPRIGVEKDGMKLTPTGVQSVALSKDLEEKFNFTDAQAYFVLDGYENLKKFRREVNRSVDGVKAYPAINTMRLMDARKAITAFEKLGWTRGDLTTLSQYKEKMAQQPTMMGGSSKNIAEVYEFIVRNYVDWEKDRYLVIVPPSGYVWDADMTDMYVQDLKALEAHFGVESAGFIQIWKWLLEHMMPDLTYSSLAAFVLMVLSILFTTRSVRATLIPSFSLVAVFAATLSLIGMVGIKFNYVNVMAFPMIVGMGIDYIVYMYERLRKAPAGRTEAIASMGKVVFISMMCTFVSFGDISFSIHKGLAQTGQIACAGVALSLVTSLFVVPALVRIFHGPEKAGRRFSPDQSQASSSV
jgi:predicted RND superfamily exporter protein